MKNSLLIHNDNVPFKSTFKETIVFKPNNVHIDHYITYEIIPQIKKLNFNVIYIKDNLSSNYLELYGLRLIYHIRLSQELGYKRLFPIVLLSDLDSYLLNKLTSMARVLFSKNIFITKNSLTSVKFFEDLDIKAFEEIEYENSFLNLIEVEAPKDYLSHHDISNEWAIYRWSNFLKVESEAIKINREKIASMLYFKYLLAKKTLDIEKKNGIQFVPRPPKNSGKILYIDDEWAKGWGDIFKQYFSKNPNIEFETFEYNFKDNDKLKIISSIKTKCLECDPDVVLLDLRLTQSDHKNIAVSDFTGIKITEIIKEINPAIQIIMLTATGKSTILENLYEHGILGYIKKEHPDDVRINTKESLDKLKNLVDKGLDKKYLKEIWNIQQSIKPFNSNIKIEIDSVFEILNSDMKNKFVYAMFAIFKCIEMINDYYIIDGYKKATWKDTKEEFSDNSTKNKICIILDKKLNLKNKLIYKNIEEIIKIRNNTIHPKRGKIEEINQKHIITWFKMLQIILEKIGNK